MKYTRQSTDEELIRGCRKEDRIAQKCLYERYFGKMMGISMRYAGNQDEALDILNTAFLKVFTSLDKYETQGNLGGWIARIVFNCSIDHVRRQATYRKIMDYDTPGEIPVHNDALDNLQTADIFNIIQKLPPATRSVFSLYVVEGYKHQEIAELLNISEGTSKWHLSEGRKELQRLIKNQKIKEALPNSI